MDNNNEPLLAEFLRCCRQLPTPRVLELGVKRSRPAYSTRHDVWVPHAAEYVGSDFQAGVDVDLVVDAHNMVPAVGESSFDIVITCSTFEHFKYPWLVAHQIMRVLKPGGLLFVQTHQTFPLHSYPHDYYRFTTDALMSLFNPSMGMQVWSEYAFPAQIHSEKNPGTKDHPSFLNVLLFGRKVSATPVELVYEFEAPPPAV
jgi:SAM-dependent methyltransferase